MTGQLLKGLSPSSSHRGGIQSPPPACVWSALEWLLVTQLSPSPFEWSGIVSLTRILLPRTTKERPSFHPYTHIHTFTHAYIEEQTVESSLRAAVTFFPSVWLEAARKSRCIQYFRRVPCPLSQWSVFHDCIILRFIHFVHVHFWSKVVGENLFSWGRTEQIKKCWSCF